MSPSTFGNFIGVLFISRKAVDLYFNSMCGRFVIKSVGEIIRDQFGDYESFEEYIPNFNVSPTDNAPVILQSKGKKQVRQLRWGLIPYFAKDEKLSFNTINARSEKITSTVAMGETATNGVRNFRRSGYYVQGAYRQEVDQHLIKYVDFVTRFGVKDENSTTQTTSDQNQWAVGINWGIFDDVIVKVERQFNHERHGRKLSDDAWLGQLSVRF